MAEQPLRLAAEDAEDITVLSACLQDAALRLTDISWDKRQRRFALLLSRFRWEEPAAPHGAYDGPERRRPSRIASGLHFDGVLKVTAQGIDQADKARVLELLAIACEPGHDGAARLDLIFSGDASIRLEVECIDAQLKDIGQPFSVRHRPEHKLAADETKT